MCRGGVWRGECVRGGPFGGGVVGSAWWPISSRARSMSPARRSWSISSRGAERLSVAGRGLAARRVETAVSWKRDGHRSAAHWLPRTTGVSVGRRRGRCRPPGSWRPYRTTAEAFRAGELSEAQAGEIAAPRPWTRRGSAVVGTGALVRRSRGCATSAGKRRSAPSDDARGRAACTKPGRCVYLDRTRRFLSAGRLARARRGCRLDSALENKTDEIFRAARRAGHREPRVAYMADAVVAFLARGPSKPIEVRLDADDAALERGYVEAGERCEIAGIGPIPVTMARALLNDARITVFGHEGSDITRISSPDADDPRQAAPLARSHLPRVWRRRLRLQRTPRDRPHRPRRGPRPHRRDQLWRLCPHHHKLKTYYGWKVEGPVGARRLVPPDDPDPP